MSEQINKSRLNELLGIKDGESFDDYMSEGTTIDDSQMVIDQTSKLIEETKAKVDEIDQQFKQDIQVIDEAKTQLESIDLNGDSNGSASNRIDTLVNVDGAFKSIEDLVDTTKQMIGTVYSIISSCDVLDSETVSAAASLIGETRQLISEYTGLYKQRIKFFDNVKMETLKQNNRLELLREKYRLDNEKWKGQHPETNAEVVDVVNGQSVPPGMVSFGTDDMLKMLQKLDEEDGASDLVDEDADKSYDDNEEQTT